MSKKLKKGQRVTFTKTPHDGSKTFLGTIEFVGDQNMIIVEDGSGERWSKQHDGSVVAANH